MKKIFVLLIALVMVPVVTFAAGINLHELNGSDLGMGVGARAISMAGAFTALGDDASALYWNPAAITEMDRNEAMFMVDIDPTRYSYKALVYRPGRKDSNRYNVTIGLARTNRLKFVGEGDWASGNAPHLVDISMIAMDPYTFAKGGGINSRTKDWRITVAGRIPGFEKLSLGVTYVDFKCVTTFYGPEGGRICQIVAYDTFDFGLHYRHNDRTNFGLSFRNPFEQTKPKYVNAGVAMFRGKDIYTFDMEKIFGNYSSDLRSVDFFMLRAGMERSYDNGWKLRGGIILPLQAKTSTLGNVRSQLPSPKFDGTFGVGYTYKDYTADLAIYGDPGWGYIQKEVKASTCLTLRMAF